MELPADDNILLSLINCKLRDGYASLEEFCEDEDADSGEITARMLRLGYKYDREYNAFKRV